MFKFIIMIDVNGNEVTEDFSTASEFLELMENGISDNHSDSLPLDSVVQSVSYGGTTISDEFWREKGVETVNDLYDWMISEDCDWFY